ncbi:uncharacterized protein DSM5745_08926 [Aspergillus mulundensis]|uniref:SWIM-type domain-containing protein n=1 Tax=Aspergillus mulundensis TaxID=1810919 RepID=A0A3D8R598_9EURO|nr:hypothetical protein DSM5745_08926 [Aspergillus mulundensis]RDW69166.1 hypothetical protein DSM5745_08926 [Aspergillus mulundensis]
MTLPLPTQFINSLLTQLSHLTTPGTAQIRDDELRTQPQTQRHGHPRLTQAPSSVFPTSQLATLKPLMLTLHCIFPNEFLLALDILDRGLVRRVRSHTRAQHDMSAETGDGVASRKEDERAETQTQTQTQIQSKGPAKTVIEDFFFVASASTITSTSRSLFPASQQPGGGYHHQAQRQRQAWQEKGYEVRIKAWNCTCPSFVISAFRDLGPEPSSAPPSSSLSSQTEGADIEDAGSDHNHTTDHISDHASADADTPNTNAYYHAYSFGGTLPLHPESAPPVCKHILACLMAALCHDLGLNGEEEESQVVTICREEVAALCAGWGG